MACVDKSKSLVHNHNVFDFFFGTGEFSKTERCRKEGILYDRNLSIPDIILKYKKIVYFLVHGLSNNMNECFETFFSVCIIYDLGIILPSYIIMMQKEV